MKESIQSRDFFTCLSKRYQTGNSYLCFTMESRCIFRLTIVFWDDISEPFSLNQLHGNRNQCNTEHGKKANSFFQMHLMALKSRGVKPYWLILIFFCCLFISIHYTLFSNIWYNSPFPFPNEDIYFGINQWYLCMLQITPEVILWVKSFPQCTICT